MSRDTEVAWAAGLFEGEGSFTSRGQKLANGATVRKLRCDMSSTDLDVLQRFQLIVGGAIYPVRPDPRNPNGRPVWHWRSSEGEKGFREILRLFAPYLGERRLATALDLLEKHGSRQEALPLHEEVAS